MQLGSTYLGSDRCAFSLWAPLAQQVFVHILAPNEQHLTLQPSERGYWQGEATTPVNSLYYLQVDDRPEHPDPASHYQPQGPHGPSQVIDHRAFVWTDTAWSGLPLAQFVTYELHVGTFTPEGTFEAIIPRLPVLKELGITAIEIMPVAQFPGTRNWGYDGAFPFAVQQSYGGPTGLKKLVNACHELGLAVVLDVVYNHLGPEGNYLWGMGTYFTDHYRTPWGSAVNFDGAYSDGTRYYFVSNVLNWFQNYHIDALRLDAVHAIYDFGAKHILQEMAEATAALSQQHDRPYYLIAESDLNDVRILRPVEKGGYGINAQWSDDFHHALHTLLTGERQGYYQDFGQLEQLAKVLQRGFAYTWDYAPGRKRYHGSDPSDRPAEQFVVCSQNHDQVGNRMLGDRFSHLLSFEAQKLAAATTLLSPYLPLLFMGEEYGETAPFLYFVSHTDPGLIEAVRQGRKAEFEDFHAQGEAPDPQSEATFQQSKLHWDLRLQGHHQTLWQFYQTLLYLRRDVPALANLDKDCLQVATDSAQQRLVLHRWFQHSQILCLLNFNAEPITFSLHPGNFRGNDRATPPSRQGTWYQILDSAAQNWGGPGSALPLSLTDTDLITMQPHSFGLYRR